jgi:hypothetical protein
MSDYNWCHGPECHKRKTTTRVRGVKGSKVLRTIKFALNSYRAVFNLEILLRSDLYA